MEIMDKSKGLDSGEAMIDYIKQRILEELKWQTILYNTRVSNDREGTEKINPLSSSSWECVDGRVSTFGQLRYPGGSMGLLVTLFSTLKEAGIDFGLEEVKGIFEKIMGPVHYHTDSHAKGDLPIACEGCGHLRLAYQNPETYKIDPQWIDYLAPLNKKETDTQSGSCTCLSGEHKEMAVVTYKDANKVQTPASRYHDGTSFFVYHAGVATETLKKLMEEIYKELKLAIDLQDLKDKLSEMQDLQVGETVARLAENLPKIEIDDVIE